MKIKTRHATPKQMATKEQSQKELLEILASRDEKIRELSQTLALVTYAKQEWERTADSLPELIAILNRERKLVRMNKALAQHLESSYEKLLGSDFCFCAASDKDGNACLHQKVLNEGKTYQEERYDPKYGGHFELSVIPCHAKDGNLTGTIHIARNINERKAFEKQRDELKAGMLQSQKLLSVGQLAAGIAHEINTPAQYVATNVDFLKDSFANIAALMECLKKYFEVMEPIDARQEKSGTVQNMLIDADWEYLVEEIPLALGQCQEGLRQISSIVGAMKEFAHPGSKAKIATDLNRIITTTIKVCQNEWKHIAELKTDLAADLPQVACYADEMGQVFLNLIVNAAHAIKDHIDAGKIQGKGSIVIATWQEKDKVKISVADNGIGIPPSIHARIFDPFFTTKQVGKGTGQGLAITHDVIANKHKGSIHVTSNEGQGTVFTITMPLRA